MGIRRHERHDQGRHRRDAERSRSDAGGHADEYERQHRNVPLLEEGKLDTGQCTGEVLYEAIAGIGRKPADVKILSAMYSNSGMFIVRADSPYKTVADLKGKRIGVTTLGSLTEWLTRKLSQQQGWGPNGIEVMPLGAVKV